LGSKGHVHLFLTSALNGDQPVSQSVALSSKKEFSVLMGGWVIPRAILDEMEKEKLSASITNIPRYVKIDN
jgi:hypothetical protein